MTWQEAARGIEPWPGAKIVGGGIVTKPRPTKKGWAHAIFPPRDIEVYELDCGRWTVDLADPDTRAAFDRRLALRLCPKPEWVEEKYTVSFYNGVLTVEAGRTPDTEYIDDPYRWSWFEQYAECPNDDPLLARALAWRSVPDASTPERT